MRRNWAFGDLLSSLFERSGTVKGNSDTRSLPELSEALLSTEGEVSGYKLAATLLDRYHSADENERLAFFEYLNAQLDVDAARISELAKTYETDPSAEAFRALSQASEPRRQELLRRLNQPVGATRAIVEMRVDLLRYVKVHPDLVRTDYDFIHLLRSWFNRGFLVLSQINWSTPAETLDKIVAYEAVHQIDDFDDLRRRLAPPDRRCFAFFHPSMPEEPLIFVEVALTEDVPNSIGDLLSEDRSPIEPENASTATFYSISNCQKGLAGISFGNLLIKQVVTELSLELPSLDTFVTLSPIPGFTRWLAAQIDDPELGEAARAAMDQTLPDETLCGLAARYLLTAQRDDGKPLDPVARFHLGNGAEIHDLHAGADPSENGVGQSLGVMVNYLYALDHTEQNHEAFALRGEVIASRAVASLATQTLEIAKTGKVA